MDLSAAAKSVGWEFIYERGAAYEFVLNHVVDSATPTSMVRTEIGVKNLV